MTNEGQVADHYGHGRLIEAIEAGLAKMGKTTEQVTIDDLGPVDEFHIGGRTATSEFLDQLAITPDHHVLDVGSGIGGASRFVSDRYGARVAGIDLTAEFVDTAKVLSAWVGLSDRVAFHHGSALEQPFADASFDAAFMLHVGMNIADKAALFAEIWRVLKPGGVLGIYDVMRIGDGDLTFPCPGPVSRQPARWPGRQIMKLDLVRSGLTFGRRAIAAISPSVFSTTCAPARPEPTVRHHSACTF